MVVSRPHTFPMTSCKKNIASRHPASSVSNTTKDYKSLLRFHQATLPAFTGRSADKASRVGFNHPRWFEKLKACMGRALFWCPRTARKPPCLRVPLVRACRCRLAHVQYTERPALEAPLLLVARILSVSYVKIFFYTSKISSTPDGAMPPMLVSTETSAMTRKKGSP